MGQLQAGDDVTHGVNAWEIRTQPLIGQDESPVDRDADLFVAHAAAVWTATDGHEEQLGFDRVAVFEGHLDAVVRVLDTGELHARLEADAALAEGALECLRAGLVLGRHEPGKHLDDRHVGPEGLPDARELDADHTATEDDNTGRHAVEQQRVVAGDNALAVDLKPGQRPRVRTRSEHDVAASDLLAVHVDGVRRDQPANALDIGDAAALDQTLEAFVEPGDNTVLVRVDAGHVDPEELSFDAELVALTGGIRHLCGMEQRFRRDAAVMEAGASQLAFLDERNGEVEFGGS